MPDLERLRQLKDAVKAANADLHAAYAEEGYHLVSTGSYEDTKFWYIHEILMVYFSFATSEYDRWFEQGLKDGWIQSAELIDLYELLSWSKKTDAEDKD